MASFDSIRAGGRECPSWRTEASASTACCQR
jgi:hypothetical protein